MGGESSEPSSTHLLRSMGSTWRAIQLMVRSLPRTRIPCRASASLKIETNNPAGLWTVTSLVYPRSSNGICPEM